MVTMETKMEEDKGGVEGGVEGGVAGAVTPLDCLADRLECGIAKNQRKQKLEENANR